MYRSTLTIAALFFVVAASAVAQQVPLDLLIRTVAVPPIATDIENSRDLVLADLDGDGDLDVMVTNQNQNNALYWNGGYGVFTRQTTTAICNDGGNSFGVAAGDIDGDDDLDIFVANRGGEANFLYINQGGLQGGSEGVFFREFGDVVATDVGNSRGAAFGDIDGDGDLDLFVANTSNEDNWLYVNQGGAQGGTQGSFERVTTGPVVNDGGVSHEGAFGDIDGDGDLDLYVANGGGAVGSPGANNFLYVNDGSGSFTRITTGPAALDVGNSKDAVFGDMDGDGDLDLFVANNQAEANDLYVNNGSGVFSAVTTGPIVEGTKESEAGLWLDMDNDGDQDLFVANQDLQENDLFLNDGSGNFQAQTLGPLPQDIASSQSAAAGDLNGDGFLDLVVVNRGLEANDIYRGEGPQWRNLGNATPGVSGNPTLSSTGNFLNGQLQTFTVENAAPMADIFHVVGFSNINAPFMGGVMVPAPDMLFKFTTSPSGTSAVGGVLPASVPPSFSLYYQCWIVDDAAPGFFSATNAVTVRAP